VLFQEQQEAAGFDVQLVEFAAVENPGRPVYPRLVDGGALARQGVEPVEGLADLGAGEPGFGQFPDQWTVQRGEVVAGEDRVVGEIMLEEVEQDIQDAFFHVPRPAPSGAVNRCQAPIRA